MPRIHTVQTQSAFPLRRAYERLVAPLLDGPAPGEPPAKIDLGVDDRRALEIRDRVPPEAVRTALREAIQHRGRFMRPWATAPRSIAYGILDDETYDWLAVTEGMLATGGIPLVVTEETLAAAHQLGGEHTPIRAEPTGTAGLAGLLELQRAGAIGPTDTTALLFTGVER